MEMDELKRRALIAKQRLKMGYWQKMENERREMEKSEVSLRGISELQRAKVSRDVLRATDEEAADREEKLYAKVCEILDSDEDIIGPIGKLIDKEYYARLDEFGRQKYVLELSSKFRELTKRYYLERSGKTSC